MPTQTFLMKELPPVSHSEKTYGFHTLRQLAESPDMLDRGSVGRIRFIGPMDFDGALCHDWRIHGRIIGMMLYHISTYTRNGHSE